MFVVAQEIDRPLDRHLVVVGEGHRHVEGVSHHVNRARGRRGRDQRASVRQDTGVVGLHQNGLALGMGEPIVDFRPKLGDLPGRKVVRRLAGELLVVKKKIVAEDIVRQGIISTSVRSWRRADSAGKVPRAIRFGGRKLWRLADLRAWVAQGCPDRREFEHAISNGTATEVAR